MNNQIVNFPTFEKILTMNKLLLTVLTLLLTTVSFAQTQDEILAEGWLMYYSERASWHGTDIFMEKFPEKRDKIGGYLSYTDETDKMHKCIFFDKQSDPGVLATISFDKNFQVEDAVINTDDRKLTAIEKQLYIIREKALDAVGEDKDGLFQFYENTNYNMVPLIVKGQKKVYILTGPTNSGVVIFGNDYLLTFDKNDKLKSKKKIHNNILPVNYKDGMIQTSGFHSHLDSTGDLITATDICTLLLYGPYTGWDTYTVVSDKNVSIWDCKKETLLVLTRKAWDRIAEHQEKLQKEREKEKNKE